MTAATGTNPPAASPLVRVRLDIRYEGTDFSGWARQPGRRTVQGALESALSTLLRVPETRLVVAGRTDAGVHAEGQVAHLDVPADAWAGIDDRLLDRLAAVLPADVRVVRIRETPAAFDARFGALWRRYEYRISDERAGVDPLRRRDVLDWRRPLNVEVMAVAASALVGMHDFAAFCRQRQYGTTIRTVQQFDVRRDGGCVVCTVRADAFCHSMVRSLVGALLAVGSGRRPPSWPAELLVLDHRADEITVAPAHGLTLVEVAYPPDDELAARAELTRATRLPLTS
ncbi:MAG TPA: tRNA pseudouridine(38-40) synthase TruA [Jatrophihabitantaceae bacterium]